MGRTNKEEISNKHKLFLDYWLESNNITESAKKAGFSAKTAGSRGSQLLKDPRSKAYLEQMKIKMLEHQENTIANTAEIAEYLTRVMRGEETDTCLVNGKERNIGIAERTRAAVELSKLVNVTTPTEERVVIIDGITRDNK